MNIRRAGIAALLSTVIAGGVVAGTAGPASAEPKGGPGACATMSSLFDWYYARWQFWVTMGSVDKQLGLTTKATYDASQADFWHLATESENRAGQRAGCW